MNFMRFKLLLLLTTLLYLTSINAQKRMDLEFENGRFLEGYGKIKSDTKIFFSKTKKGYKSTYNYKDGLRRITVYYDRYENVYEYKLLGQGKFEEFRLLRIEVDGKVSLYEETISGSFPAGMNGMPSQSYSNTTYYLSKNGGNRVREIASNNVYKNKFIEFAKGYFWDCPELIKKIESKSYFRRYDLVEVIRYYNNQCDLN